MKKKRIFGKEALGWVWGILAAAVVIQTGEIFWAVGAKALSFRGMVAALGITAAAAAAAGTMVHRFLTKPYSQSQNLFQYFIQSGNYQELMNRDYEIFEGQNEVMKKLDAMLDKQNIIQLSTKHAELLALQNQINPHFLYNTLDAIRGDALCEGIESIADTTEALSTFFRYTITDTGNLVSLEDELENVENYFKIQQYRFGDKLKMKVVFPDDYGKVQQCKLPKLTLQPVIENAIFHGLESKAEGGLITITIDITENKLLLSIHDDGVGIPEEELRLINSRLEDISNVPTEEHKKGGIALPNVARRIKLLFGEEYGIHIYSIPNLGTDAKITVPIGNSHE